MALISLIAKNSVKIEWGDLLLQVRELITKVEIEIFPIPLELGFSENAIGISVQNNITDKKEILINLLVVINFLIEHNFYIIELYNGDTINSENVNKILNSLLNI